MRGGGAALVGAVPAQAVAQQVFVDTTADEASSFVCTPTTPPAEPLTLRQALCVAATCRPVRPSSVRATTSLSSALGALVVDPQKASSITVQGAPGNTSTITGDGAHQVFNLDPSLTGGLSVTLDGLTIEHGVDNLYGGGAMIGGSANATTIDSLTVTNSTFTSNAANTAGSATQQPRRGHPVHRWSAQRERLDILGQRLGCELGWRDRLPGAGRGYG